MLNKGPSGNKEEESVSEPDSMSVFCRCRLLYYP